MQRYIFWRFVQAIICLIAVGTIVFFGTRLTGSPLEVLLPEDASAADYAAMSAHLGLDKPLVVQYGLFLSHAVRGDFGESTFMQGSAFEIAIERLPATLELASVAILVCILLALPLGVYAAVNRGRPFDLGARMFAVLGQSLPAFWLGLVLMLVFAVWLGILPAAGRGGFSNIVLPAITIGYYQVAGITRLMRSSMLDVLDSEYIKLARIKGLSERVVIWKHGFKNALIPVVTFSVVVFVHMLAGAVVTETVFAWPGVGRLVIQAVNWRDYPIVQSAVIIIATMNIVANLGVDILYAYLNPRVRYGK